ncbi:MAG: molybdopterin-dependent oxidoreductase [Pirellulales bacterium]
MPTEIEKFIDHHIEVSRRYFLQCGVAGTSALAAWPLLAADPARNPVLQKAIENLEPFLTTQEGFRDVSRGNPKPHSLSDETKQEVGLTRDSWSLEVLSDPDNPARLRNPLSKEEGNALTFEGLMNLAKKNSVRFAKVMTCLNIGCPLGTGIWEGVPLRDVLWLTQPRDNVRRVYYYGYHNDKPEQIFRSSLPVDRVLEDHFDLPPVILCYKLNGDWLSSKRGGPVRMVVPEGYGFKSVKWLTHVYLSNVFNANDTYAKGNNDVHSALKSFAETISVPQKVKAGESIPVTGYAQVGISGVSKVQTWLHADKDKLPDNDPYFQQSPWQDAEILGPPSVWGGNLPDGKIPQSTMGFNSETGEPKQWPMRFLKIHWATLLSGMPAGEYTFRCRTVDDKGHAQPMPRPFRKSGRASIETVGITVE